MKKNKTHCKGCHDNFYNGNNPLGIEECWQYEDAEFVKRIPIGMNEPPPYLNKKEVKVFNCWQGKGAGRIIYVNKKVLTEDGYWK